MSDKPEYIYIMYPIKLEEAKNLPLPFLKQEQPVIMENSESFVPLWFGNARFPEDDIDD